MRISADNIEKHSFLPFIKSDRIRLLKGVEEVFIVSADVLFLYVVRTFELLVYCNIVLNSENGTYHSALSLGPKKKFF